MKRVLLIVFVGLMSLSLSAQITMEDHHGPIADGSSITVDGKPDTVLTADIKITNAGTSVKDIKVKKVELSTISGSMNTYCFADQCYGSNTIISPHHVSLAPNEADSSFMGEYYPLGTTGLTSVMYVFFDMNNPNDSVSVTVHYNSTVGIANVEEKTLEFSNAYPNPATEKVFFDYYVPSGYTNVIFLIRDLTGKTVYEENILNKEGKLEVNLLEIENGIYFYSVLTDGQSALTRKLIVKK